MADTISRPQFSSLMKKELDHCGMIEVKRYATQYDQMCNIARIAKKQYVHQEEGGVGLLQVKDENTPLTFGQIYEGYRNTIEPRTHCLGLRFTQEFIEDDLHGMTKQWVARLSANGVRTYEYYGALLWNNAAVTTYYSTPDGQALCSDSHTHVPGLGAFDNYQAVALGVTGLQSLIILARTATDEHGIRISATPNKLTVGPNCEFVAAELLHSTHDPESDKNAINAIRNRYNLKLNVWNELTGNKYFLTCEEKHGVMFIVRIPLQSGRSGDFLTTNSLYMVRTRFELGVNHPRNVFGSFV